MHSTQMRLLMRGNDCNKPCLYKEWRMPAGYAFFTPTSNHCRTATIKTIVRQHDTLVACTRRRHLCPWRSSMRRVVASCAQNLGQSKGMVLCKLPSFLQNETISQKQTTITVAGMICSHHYILNTYEHTQNMFLAMLCMKRLPICMLCMSMNCANTLRVFVMAETGSKHKPPNTQNQLA